MIGVSGGFEVGSVSVHTTQNRGLPQRRLLRDA